MNQNRCVCCDEIIPEGRQVCPQCLNSRKTWFVAEVDPAENGAYQYGVFECIVLNNKPHIRLTRPKLIATFSHEWRAERFIKEKCKEQNDG